MQKRRTSSKPNKSVVSKNYSKCDAIIDLLKPKNQANQCQSKCDNVDTQSSLVNEKPSSNIYAEKKDSIKAMKVKVKSKSSKCQVFFCDKCDKVYDQYSELVYHERRHTGEKPFHCTWPGCKKAFSASNARVRHLRTHTGEKPYSCPFNECGRRFTYWKDLKLHKYRHTGDNSF